MCFNGALQRCLNANSGLTSSLTQIIDAAANLKTYIGICYRLPDNVTINGTVINISQFLDLLMCATLQLNSGTNDPLVLKSYTNPNNPVDNIKSGNIIKSDYIKIANDLKDYMHNTGRTPDYQYGTSLGTHLGFQNLVQMYSFILYVNKVANYLPNFVPMKPWSSVTKWSAGIIPDGPHICHAAD